LTINISKLLPIPNLRKALSLYLPFLLLRRVRERKRKRKTPKGKHSLRRERGEGEN